MGGLSLPSAALLALPCFLSSTSATSNMVKALVFYRVQLIQGVDSTLAMWKTQTGIDAHDAPASNSQSKLVAAASQKRYHEITESSPELIT